MMIVRQKLSPGQRGTKKLLKTYGDQLVCVRYRCDAQRKKRFKTVELVIDEGDWQPVGVDATDDGPADRPVD